MKRTLQLSLVTAIFVLSANSFGQESTQAPVSVATSEIEPASGLTRLRSGKKNRPRARSFYRLEKRSGFFVSVARFFRLKAILKGLKKSNVKIGAKIKPVLAKLRPHWMETVAGASGVVALGILATLLSMSMRSSRQPHLFLSPAKPLVVSASASPADASAASSAAAATAADDSSEAERLCEQGAAKARRRAADELAVSTVVPGAGAVGAAEGADVDAAEGADVDAAPLVGAAAVTGADDVAVTDAAPHRVAPVGAVPEAGAVAHNPAGGGGDDHGNVVQSFLIQAQGLVAGNPIGSSARTSGHAVLSSDGTVEDQHRAVIQKIVLCFSRLNLDCKRCILQAAAKPVGLFKSATLEKGLTEDIIILRALASVKLDALDATEKTSNNKAAVLYRLKRKYRELIKKILNSNEYFLNASPLFSAAVLPAAPSQRSSAETANADASDRAAVSDGSGGSFGAGAGIAAGAARCGSGAGAGDRRISVVSAASPEVSGAPETNAQPSVARLSVAVAPPVATHAPATPVIPATPPAAFTQASSAAAVVIPPVTDSAAVPAAAPVTSAAQPAAAQPAATPVAQSSVARLSVAVVPPVATDAPARVAVTQTPPAVSSTPPSAAVTDSALPMTTTVVPSAADSTLVTQPLEASASSAATFTSPGADAAQSAADSALPAVSADSALPMAQSSVSATRPSATATASSLFRRAGGLFRTAKDAVQQAAPGVISDATTLANSVASTGARVAENAVPTLMTVAAGAAGAAARAANVGARMAGNVEQVAGAVGTGIVLSVGSASTPPSQGQALAAVGGLMATGGVEHAATGAKIGLAAIADLAGQAAAALSGQTGNPPPAIDGSTANQPDR